MTIRTKIVSAIIVLIVIIAAGIAYNFYDNNLRGAGPAVRDPQEDITQLIPPGQPPSNTSGNPPPTANTTGMPLKLPDGFGINIFAKNLGGPRVLATDPSGRMIASLTSQGKVVALPDENVDFTADKTISLLEGLDSPHGLAFHCEGNSAVQSCKLFVAEEGRVVRYDYEQGTPRASNGKKILDLPTTGGGHSTRTLLILDTPKGKRLLTSIGSSCNVCEENDPRRASIYSSNLDGSDFRSFATGLRNSVFMQLHPVTGKLWATEMGRDLIGDDIPPDEVNIIEQGKNYGWPICYGKGVHDTSFDKSQYIRNPCEDRVGSHIDIPAHSAPLGLAFAPEQGWPEDYRNDLFVSLHGSWNRSTPSGYKVVRYDLDPQGNVKGVSDFIVGFLPGANAKAALGRPVDIITFPGGHMYISDDKAGVIYHVWYKTY